MSAISILSSSKLWIFYLLFAEAFRAPIFRIGGPDKNGYNMGRYNNLQEVFGDDKLMWFLPVFTRYVLRFNCIAHYKEN